MGIILITVCKWVVQCKSRGRYREELQKNIRQYIREELATGNWRELEVLNPAPLEAETAYVTMSEATGSN